MIEIRDLSETPPRITYVDANAIVTSTVSVASVDVMANGLVIIRVTRPVAVRANPEEGVLTLVNAGG